jgi:hypothetical protein
MAASNQRQSAHRGPAFLPFGQTLKGITYRLGSMLACTRHCEELICKLDRLLPLSRRFLLLLCQAAP